MDKIEKMIIFSFLLQGVWCDDPSTSLTEKIKTLNRSYTLSCKRTNVTVCFCEADGNPSQLEWRLSVTNSTNTSISEERLSSTSLRSSITFHHSLTDTLTVQCASTNAEGTDTRVFKLLFPLQETTTLCILFLLIGAAFGASVMMVLCVITHLCVWTKNKNPTQTRQEDTSRRIATDDADLQKNEEESIYANQAMLSSAGTNTLNPPESSRIAYTSINFQNKKSKTTDKGLLTNSDEASQLYAEVKH